MKIATFYIITLFSTTYLFSQKTSLTNYKPFFDKNLKRWTQSFKNFHFEKIRISDTVSFENTPFCDTKNLKAFYNLYKPGLSFSWDTSHFLDIYSYWLNLEKKGNKIVANAEVDQAVSLCDLKNNKWIRIYFCGYSTRIDEAVWIDRRYFILAGTLLDYKDVFHPKILIGDMTKKVFYVYNDSVSMALETGYTSEKFKKLNIQE